MIGNNELSNEVKGYSDRLADLRKNPNENEIYTLGKEKITGEAFRRVLIDDFNDLVENPNIEGENIQNGIAEYISPYHNFRCF